MAVHDREVTSSAHALDRRIDATGWGLFLVWLGVALLANLGWGVGLLGAALITLGAQAWRWRRGLEADRFALVLGALLAVSGISNLLDWRIDVLPVLLILAGAALLASAWRRRRSVEGGDGAHAPRHA